MFDVPVKAKIIPIINNDLDVFFITDTPTYETAIPRVSWNASTNKGRECNNQYYRGASSTDRNDSVYEVSNPEVEAEYSYAFLDRINENDGKREYSADQSNFTTANPVDEERSLVVNHAGPVAELESDNPYYGGITSPEMIHDGSSRKVKHRETDYAEIDVNRPTLIACQETVSSDDIGRDNIAQLDQVQNYENTYCDQDRLYEYFL